MRRFVVAQAPHVRCSQAAAAVGDDVFFFGGSYYKCAGSPSILALAGACLHASVTYDWMGLHTLLWRAAAVYPYCKMWGAGRTSLGCSR